MDYDSPPESPSLGPRTQSCRVPREPQLLSPQARRLSYQGDILKEGSRRQLLTRGPGSLRSLGDGSLVTHGSFDDGRSVASHRTRETSYSFDSRYEVPQDLLMFFQAGPLVYTLANEVHPLDQIDFDVEREIIKEAIEDVADNQIAISFETATANLLGRFLAKGEGRVLHFSCHGHPDYLFVEDGWAGAQPLFVPDLQSWMQKGGGGLELVFVSACHSRTMGESFVKAGVNHVVCCQKDSQKVHNVAAIEFEKAFYRALACGRTLLGAFKLAQQEVLCSPLIPWEERRQEVKKFVLLPEEGVNHNVYIFFTEPLSPRSTYLRKRAPLNSCFPPPPSVFLGREVDMYRVIGDLKWSRLVRVSGPPGVGSNALVKACCRYISERSQLFGFDEILWMPMEQDNDISRCFAELYESFHDVGDRSVLYFQLRESGGCVQRIINHFHSRNCKSLLVLDAKKILLEDGIKKFTFFVETLLQGTKHVKLIILHRPGVQISSSKMPSAESDIIIPPLAFEKTANLFARMCQHVKNRTCSVVGSPGEFVKLMLGGKNICPEDRMSKRLANIYSLLGEGIPELVMTKAREMTENEFRRLVDVACRPEPCLPVIESRAALEKHFRDVSEEIARACRDKQYERAQEFQESLDELELLRTEFPQLAVLESMARDVRFEQEFAVRSKNFMDADKLQKELEQLDLKIQIERDAMIAFGSDLSNAGVSDIEPEDQEGTGSAALTRAGLLVKIRELEDDLAEASDGNQFVKAKEIDLELSDLKRRALSMPDSEKLSNQVFTLRSELKQKKADRRWDEAKVLHTQLIKVEEVLALEQRAEAESKVGKVQRSDPPGLYLTGGTRHGHGGDVGSGADVREEPYNPMEEERYASKNRSRDLELASPRAAARAAAARFAATDDNLASRPGAVRVAGIDSLDNYDDDNDDGTIKVGDDSTAKVSGGGLPIKGGDKLPVANLVTSIEEQEAVAQSLQEEAEQRSAAPSQSSASNLYTAAMLSGALEASRAEADADEMNEVCSSFSLSSDEKKDKVEEEQEAKGGQESLSKPHLRGSAVDQDTAASQNSAASAYLAPGQVIETEEELVFDLEKQMSARAVSEGIETEEERVARLVEDAMNRRLLAAPVVAAEQVEADEEARPRRNSWGVLGLLFRRRRRRSRR
jgi:hypothetical protein